MLLQNSARSIVNDFYLATTIASTYDSELVLTKISVAAHKGDTESGGFCLCWKTSKVYY